MVILDDETQAIGRRYRRQDEVGTPLCVTIDFDSLDDGAVTIRDRDSTAQVRVPIDTLLATNHVMLEKGLARQPKQLDDCTIVEPVYIEDGVVAMGSTIGPNVCVLAGSKLLGCTVTHTLIGAQSLLARCTLTRSLVGDRVVLEGVQGEVTVGDDSEVRSKL